MFTGHVFIGAMLSSVSLPIELVRNRPRLIVACVVLLQALLWLLVPVAFYESPPGPLPWVLAQGRSLAGGGPYGPPLAFWMAEIAFRLGGIAGVYVLSQLCVAATFAAVFLLGRSIAGERHAALAVLLMAAMVVFAAPSPAFGPPVLSMALWALLLLHVWLAAWRDRRLHWIAAGAVAGLLILTSYANLWLVLLLGAYLVWTGAGRAQGVVIEPLIGLLAGLLILLPHLIWLDRPESDVLWRSPSPAVYAGLVGWLALMVLAAHVGLVLLWAFASGRLRRDLGETPEIERQPVIADERRFVFVFALAPLSTILIVPFLPDMIGWSSVAPFVLLSALAVVVLLGDRLHVVNQRLLTWIWLILVLAPAVAVIGAIVLGPQIGRPSMAVAMPSAEMGRHVAAAFERRTGRPLPIVTGDPDLAASVALGAPNRPQVYDPLRPRRTPSVKRADIEREGAVVVWRAETVRNVPPPAIAALFPGLVPEVPQAFDRRYGGSAARFGWSVIRPQVTAPAK